MLVECKHCGAPLDVKSGHGVAKCRYCGTSSRIEQTTTLAAQTPADWHAPKEWVVPQGFSATPNQHLKYRSAVRAIVLIAVLLLLLGGIVPIILAIVIPAMAISTVATTTQTIVTGNDTQQTVNAAMAQMNAALAQASQQLAAAGKQVGEAQGQGAGQTLLASEPASLLVEQYRQKLGGRRVRAMRLVIHPQFASLRAQDPDNAAHVDEYDYRNGVVSEPKPVELLGPDKLNLEAVLFDLENVALDRLTTMNQEALDKLKSEGGQVSHVIVEKSRKRTLIRVYVRGPRGGGYVEFGQSGQLVFISK